MLESLGSFPEAQYFFVEIYTNGTALAMRVFSLNHIEIRNPLTALSHITALYHLREIIQ